ncbi:unnamed protein product [Coccothraustes coccothraustes]
MGQRRALDGIGAAAGPPRGFGLPGKGPGVREEHRTCETPILSIDRLFFSAGKGYALEIAEPRQESIGRYSVGQIKMSAGSSA